MREYPACPSSICRAAHGRGCVRGREQHRASGGALTGGSSGVNDRFGARSGYSDFGPITLPSPRGRVVINSVNAPCLVARNEFEPNDPPRRRKVRRKSKP